MAPPVNFGANWRSIQGLPSIAEVSEENEVDNVDVGNLPPENQPDQALGQVVANGVGPALQPGNGQAQNFAANHDIAFGHDWDLNSPKGMLETAQKAIANIKTVITGEEKFAAFTRSTGHWKRANPQFLALGMEDM